MPKYMIPVDVTSAAGTQVFSVVANSPEEAVDIFRVTGGEFVEEEIEVIGLGTDSISVNDLWVEEA